MLGKFKSLANYEVNLIRHGVCRNNKINLVMVHFALPVERWHVCLFSYARFGDFEIRPN